MRWIDISSASKTENVLTISLRVTLQFRKCYQTAYDS